jgi:hypothetical protein
VTDERTDEQDTEDEYRFPSHSCLK